MKLKKYLQIFEDLDKPSDFGDLEEVNFNRLDETEDDTSKDTSEMDEVCYQIRKLFKIRGVDVQVNHEEFDIMVYVFLSKREKISSLLKSFDVVKKLQKDIIPDYDCEAELYENKKGFPILAFSFTTFNFG